MTSIPASLYSKSALAIVSRKEHAITVKLILEKLGFKAKVTTSLYEGMQSLKQDLPNCIVTESILSDGNAGMLYDQVTKDPVFSQVPIAVLIAQKTKQHLQPLVGRKFAALSVGTFKDKDFAMKLIALKKSLPLSPYLTLIENTKIGAKTILSSEADIIGKSKDFVVSESSTMVDPTASILCVPKGGKLGPAILKQASNFENKKAKSYFNLFPYSRIQGKGLKWLSSLDEINFDGSSASSGGGQTKRKVLFYDPEKARFDKYAKILKGYDIDLIYAKSLAVAASYLKNHIDEISSVYLHEILNDAASISWTRLYKSLEEDAQPPLIIGTSSLNNRSTEKLIYIRRPFGLGQLIEKLETSFTNAQKLCSSVEDKQGAVKKVPINYQAPIKIVSLDESGGTIQLKFPLKVGSHIKIEIPVLQELWGDAVLKIIAAQLNEHSKEWYCRFQAVESGTSKYLYWQKIQNLLKSENLLVEVAAEDVTEETTDDVKKSA